MTRYADVKAEYMAAYHDPYDRWGSYMGLFFSVADTLHSRGESTPTAWGYRPSPLGNVLSDEGEAELIAPLSGADLIRLGNALHRLTRYLERRGYAY